MQTELDMTITSPPLRYHGSKFRLAPWLISHFPAEYPEMTYVEVFGGGASVLLRKVPSKIEIYNDLDNQAYDFFRVLRNPGLRIRLAEAVELTPFSRNEFKDSVVASDDIVEAARRFVVRTFMGVGTRSMDPKDSNGFRGFNRVGKSYPAEWSNVPMHIMRAGERMKLVTLENLDFRRLIPKVDAKGTVIYVDPPYPHSTRDNHSRGYMHELSDHDHRNLAWMLHQCESKVVLSGYPCSLYDELYHDWNRDEKQTAANGQTGGVTRIEVIWKNF